MSEDGEVMDLMRPTEHPMEPWLFTDKMIAAASEDELGQIVELYKAREERIRLSEDDVGGDPYRYGYEPEHWARADEEFRKAGRGQYVAGGKRATKSERAAKRVVQAAMAFRKTKIICMQGNMTTSAAEQQPLVWKYLPKEVKALNGMRTSAGGAKISYSADKGFQASAGSMLVLPNGSQIWFLAYKMEVKEYQGWTFGAKLTPWMKRQMADKPWLNNIGAWCDEDMPMGWFETVQKRCATTGAMWMWTFSTLEGITPTIKEMLTGAKTVEQRRAVALPDTRRYVPDCEAGNVPFTQTVQKPGVSVIYFHTDLNPFPPNYENMLSIVSGKPDSVVLRDLYGYSTDTRHKAFLKFGGWNVVKEGALPAKGTNYMLTDPAGSRPWATIWVRVTDSRPRRYYIYREWPDAGKFGDWAVASADPRRPGGDRGPGQHPLGYGYVNYKRAWLEAERIAVPVKVQEMVKAGVGRGLDWELLDKLLVEGVVDPMHRELIKKKLRKGEDVCGMQEPVRCRFIDPRAGRDSQQSERGGTCPMDELAREQRDARTGEVLAKPMVFMPAVGKQEIAGVQAVNDLLDWDMDHPDGMVACLNEPHLFVSENCKNTIWCMENYVGEDGQVVLEGGCDDFADLLRYMALEDLRHVEPVANQKREGWGY